MGPPKDRTKPVQPQNRTLENSIALL